MEEHNPEQDILEFLIEALVSGLTERETTDQQSENGDRFKGEDRKLVG